MSRGFLAGLAVGAVLVIASCSSAGGSTGPSAAPSAGVSAGASASSSTSPVCTDTTEPGTVAVSIEDFEFTPAAITARTGQVITFTNTGFEHHNATSDAGCATKTLQTGERDGLVFMTAGRYPFRCSVHGWMTGTITIGG